VTATAPICTDLNIGAMSYTTIYVHVVFAVKRRKPVLSNDKRPSLFRHIRKQSALNHIDLININGFHDHIHLLLRLHASQSLSEVVQQLKGESARWANEVQLFETKLIWAEGYYARSVDPENIRVVLDYINAQPSKHTKRAPRIAAYLHLIPRE
jgi:putative transposase